MGLKTRRRVRLHLAGDAPSVEGLLVGKPRGLAGFYELIEASVLESATDRRELGSFSTLVPREKVLFLEVVKVTA